MSVPCLNHWNELKRNYLCRFNYDLLCSMCLCISLQSAYGFAWLFIVALRCAAAIVIVVTRSDTDGFGIPVFFLCLWTC